MLKRLRSDIRGIAAVEFALIAPVVILLYAGFAELTMAMMAERRAAHTASVVADLVAQTPAITGSELTDIWTIGNSIMSPFPTGTLQLRVTSVVADAQAAPRVSWSQGSGMSPLVANSIVTNIPANLLAAGDSVIMADVSYGFSSPLRMTLPNVLTFQDTFYLKPRQSTSVTFTP